MLLGTAVVVIDGKEYEVTEYTGNDTGAVDKAFEHLISSIVRDMKGGQYDPTHSI